MRVNVIIVTYNNSSTIKECIVSIPKLTTKPYIEVSAIDNNSSDDTLKIIDENFPQIKVSKNQENLGFAKANNKAIRKIKSDYVFLINPDAEFTKGSLQKMISYVEVHPDVGILGPKLINADGRIQKEIAPFPGLIDSILVLLKLHRIKPFKQIAYPDYDYEKIQEAEHLMGSALLIKRKVFEDIGLFDENFFLWFEETDFEKRAKEAGFKIVYYPKAVVNHLVGHSTKQLNPIKRQSIWNQSLRYYFQKHRPFWEQILIRPFIYVSYVLAFLLLLKNKLLNK